MAASLDPSAVEPEALPEDAGVAVDGRRRRGERSREVVIEAILDLILEGNQKPTTSQIAERSGVSVRSVFRHFDDVESLYAAAVDAHTDRVLPFFTRPLPDGTLEERIVATVAHRVDLFEAIAPVRRVGEQLRRSSPSIASRLDDARAHLARGLATTFAPELQQVPVEDRQAVLDALEAVTGWHTWESLTVFQGCSRKRTAAAMAEAVRALLAGR